ncbi:hypothetical protein F5Y04DRAFT_172841 [Hypomontagnella monticulosa]|nr:hypothetical protein F5Y04DRAFT_172841 [Hypomontagnella monticulosa]
MHGYCLAMAKEYRASGFQAATRGPLSSSQEGGGKRRAINSRDASAEGTNADNFGNAHMQHPNTLEGINRRLVCPLAVTYPDRFPDCHKSGGFKNTSRVKEHLYRCHLVSQCTRCGQIYDGDQESHGQMPPHFAINQRQKDQLQKRGGLRGMDEGQRWNKIYRVVYPYADSPYPSPCKSSRLFQCPD